MDLGIHAGRLITPDEQIEGVFVAIEGGIIRRVEPFRPERAVGVVRFVDASDQIVAPGFVDLQVNGALGHNVKQADAEQRREIYRFFLRRGTTTLVPTIVSDAREVMVKSMAALAGDVEADDPGLPTIAGLHLEGPFLNPERRGAHPPQYLRLPDPALARDLCNAAGGRLAIATLSPELEGAEELVRLFAGQGVVVAAGHTTATRDDLSRAADAGLSLITHVGNASDWPHRRKNAAGIFASEPGTVGAFMTSDRLRASLILDGYHFDPRLAAALVRLRGPRSIALTADPSYATGCAPGDYDDGAIKTTVHPDGYAYATGGGGWLAGSVITLERAVQVAVQQGGIALCDAIEMATLTPARILGVDERKGRIAPDYDADLVCLDERLTVRRVFKAGCEVPVESSR